MHLLATGVPTEWGSRFYDDAALVVSVLDRVCHVILIVLAGAAPGPLFRRNRLAWVYTRFHLWVRRIGSPRCGTR